MASDRAGELSLLMLAGAVALLPIGLWGSDNALGYLGLLDSLSPLVVIGLCLCVLSLVLQEVSTTSSNVVMLLQLMLINAYIWTIPAVLFSGLTLPAGGVSFLFYSNTAAIGQTGHIAPSTYQYQSWPLQYIFLLEIKVMSSLGYLQLFQLAAFLENAVVSILLLIFFRVWLEKGREQFAFIGVAFFQLFSFDTPLTAFSPYSFGYILFYAALAFFFWSFSSFTFTRSKKSSVTVFILLCALAVTHPEVAFVLLVAILLARVGASVRTRQFSLERYDIVILGALVTTAWFIYGAVAYVSGGNLSSYFSQAFNFLAEVLPTVHTSLGTASPGHLLVNQIRLALILVLAVGSIPVILKGVFERQTTYIVLLSFVLGIGFSFLIVGNIQGPGYLYRLLAYVLPIVVLGDFVGLTFLSRRKMFSALIIISLLAVPICYITTYGGIQSDYVPTTVIQTATYYSQFVPNHSHYDIFATQAVVGFYGNNLESINPYTTYDSGIVFIADYNVTLLPASDFKIVLLGQDAVQQLSYLSGNLTAVGNAVALLDMSHQHDLVYSSIADSLYLRTSP